MDNDQAQRGYSRDHRPDCKQVCIGLVVSTEGLPMAYEVFAGNRADVTTLPEMVEVMEKHYGVANGGARPGNGQRREFGMVEPKKGSLPGG